MKLFFDKNNIPVSSDKCQYAGYNRRIMFHDNSPWKKSGNCWEVCPDRWNVNLEVWNYEMTSPEMIKWEKHNLVI